MASSHSNSICPKFLQPTHFSNKSSTSSSRLNKNFLSETNGRQHPRHLQQAKGQISTECLPCTLDQTRRPLATQEQQGSVKRTVFSMTLTVTDIRLCGTH